jgi:hypothetical protein
MKAEAIGLLCVSVAFLLGAFLLSYALCNRAYDKGLKEGFRQGFVKGFAYETDPSNELVKTRRIEE